MGRAPCCDKVGLKKGPWTPEEDQILISFIQKHGHSNWRALPKQAGLLRCGKSCRLRWINYLRPDIKRGNFTKEEEDTIIQLHEIMGNRWSAIAAKLPGRTDNEIKNVWHTYLKKKLEKYQTTKQGKKARSSSKQAKVLKNVTITNSISTDSFPETSAGTSDNVPESSGQSSASDDFWAINEVSSVELPNMVVGARDDEPMLAIQQSNLDYYYPIIDETFWSQDFTSDDNNPTFVFTNTMDGNYSAMQETYNSFSSTYTENISNSSEEDDMEFWLDVFVKSGGEAELPEF